MGIGWSVAQAHTRAIGGRFGRLSAEWRSMSIPKTHTQNPTDAPAASAGELLAAMAQRHDRRIGRALADARHRHSGIHRARKGLRAQRALLALLRPALDPAGRARLDRVDARLKRLCKGLSRLRDAHVAVLTAEALDVASSPGLRQRLVKALTRQRDRVARQALHDDPAFAARRRMAAAICAELAVLPWHLLDTRAGKQAISRSRHRVERAARKAGRAPTAANRHRWRRRLRRLRLQVESIEQAQSLGAVIALDGLPGSHHLKQQADRLGRLQDAQLLRRLARRIDRLRNDQGLRTLLAAAVRAARASYAGAG